MTKPKQKKAEPVFLAHSFSLRDEAKSKLIELLGFSDVDPLDDSVRRQLPGKKIVRRKPGAPLILGHDPDGTADETGPDVGMAILKIEAALGLYVYGAVHIDEIPRATDYVNAFKPIGKRAAELLNMLHGLGGYFSDQFTVKRADQDAIEAALMELLQVANSVVKDFEALPSKGAKKNNALAEVVRRLRRIFRDYYQGPVDGRRKSGAFQYRAEKEKRELDFVKTALLDARIIAKGYSDLPRLFRDPRCALNEERSDTVERLAKKVSRSRKQKTDR